MHYCKGVAVILITFWILLLISLQPSYMGFKWKTAITKNESALVMHHKSPLSTSSPTEMFSSSISIGSERTFMMGTGQRWTSSAQVMQQETYELRCKGKLNNAIILLIQLYLTLLQLWFFLTFWSCFDYSLFFSLSTF